jgi:hypothetical protein
MPQGVEGRSFCLINKRLNLGWPPVQGAILHSLRQQLSHITPCAAKDCGVHAPSTALIETEVKPRKELCEVFFDAWKESSVLPHRMHLVATV